MESFWKKLKRPILVSAPMEDVSDPAFRLMLARHGKPAVIFTEFVSADGLCSRGKEKILPKLKFDEAERPIVAQLFGSKPENLKEAARICKELGFDGIDINMGCPDKSINKQKAGADLINNPTLAREIIRATKEGAADLPVSVKTRIGYNKIDTEKWLGELLAEEPAALTVHGRTKKEMSLVPCHWDEIEKARHLRESLGIKTLILGNGDVSSLKEAREKAKNHSLDGVMIGRGLFGNPWFFGETKNREQMSESEIAQALLEHCQLYDRLVRPYRSFDLMKKHFKAYFSRDKDSKRIRTELMSAKSSVDVEETLKKLDILS